jgi:hypothetical protein
MYSMQSKIVLEKQSIKKLVLYNKITKKEEELLNCIIKKYNTYIYIIRNNIYIIEFPKSKFMQSIQKQLVNEYKYTYNGNYYQKRI